MVDDRRRRLLNDRHQPSPINHRPLTIACPVASLHITLLYYTPVRLPRVLVGALRVRHLLHFDETLLLGPALIHALQAPLRAAAPRTDRLVADQHEYRVGVRRGQDAQRHPTAAVDLDVE